MNMARIAAMANPYAALVGTVFLVGMMLVTILLTDFQRQWVVFLGGALAAASLAWVSRSANARWVIARRTGQLNSVRAKLAAETRLRIRAEQSAGIGRNDVQLVNEALPAMLAYIDRDGYIRYHNRAYSRWLCVADGGIDGRRAEDVVGRAAYALIGERLSEAQQGRDVRYERTQTMPGGNTCRLHVQYLPHFAQDGTVAGVFALLSDITGVADVAKPPPAAQDGPSGAGARLIAALERDEFRLYHQPIAHLGAHAPETPCREILLRMQEEEDKHITPGSFLPLAEELGLLHEIDRWVVRHVLDFAAEAGPGRDAVYFVNLSGPTILDPGFATFVRDCLRSRRVPDHTLCFELAESEVVANPAAYRSFVNSLDGTGCRFAVSGFGCNPLTLRLLKQLRVDFLKLDGGIVLNILRSPDDLARVKAINLLAHAAGMRTIAECVESDETRTALEAIGTDFAQGFGIALPRPLVLPGKSRDPGDPDAHLEAAA